MPEQPGITKITVAGYKSISKEQSIDIRPLTILAGVNSSGKSSIMQPLLLLKQTLEAGYDPGPLMLSGTNVLFTSAEQMFSRTGNGEHVRTLKIGIKVGGQAISASFRKRRKNGLEIKEITYFSQGEALLTLSQAMTQQEIIALFPAKLARPLALFGVTLVRDRCFLGLALGGEIRKGAKSADSSSEISLAIADLAPILQSGLVKNAVVESLRGLIHLPGLRGNPERTYPVTAVGQNFPGTFEKYTASIIAKWQANKDSDKLEGLSHDLERLGLTSKVTAKPVNDTQVELQVGRLPESPKGKTTDLINIADVGFGVSQTLPVLVAIHAAAPGQVVYIEQPELHLHPRAQTAMARVLADAAKRGVQVVAETHSSLLLLGIQTLVAEGELPPELVKLHWFRRRDDGSTMIESADLDEAGAFGDWPEDFAEADLSAQSRYLDAAEARLRIH